MFSAINVDQMRSRVLTGNMFEWPVDARVIKRKLGLIWKHGVKNTVSFDHFEHRCFAVDFADEDENSSANSISGLGSHEFLSNTRMLILSRVSLKQSGVSMKVDEITLNGLNRLLVKVLLEIDLRFPLKRVRGVNGDDGSPILG